MNITDIRHRRMQVQRLIGAPFDWPEDMVTWHGAVQAQEFAMAKWGIAQRCGDVTNASLDQLFNDGGIIRTHVLRPTWHFVMPTDIRWLLALTGPRVHAGNRSRYRELEIDEGVATRAKGLISTALEGGNYLTRPELGEVLQRRGIDTSGQRLAHLVMWLELDGLICSGPRRGKQFTYALLDERVPPSPTLDPEEALAELVRRYFFSHGPATPHDFSWWSGLTVTDARKGIALLGDALTSETVGDTTWWFTPDPDPPAFDAPLVHLLPAFDEYYVGFRNHTPTFDPDIRARYDATREFWGSSFVALNGIIVGGWRRKLGASQVTITTQVPGALSTDGQAALASAAEAFGRFLELPAVMQDGLSSVRHEE